MVSTILVTKYHCFRISQASHETPESDTNWLHSSSFLVSSVSGAYITYDLATQFKLHLTDNFKSVKKKDIYLILDILEGILKMKIHRFDDLTTYTVLNFGAP